MAVSHKLLLALLVGLRSSLAVENDHQCEGSAPDSAEEGHVLLATKVVRTKLVGEELPVASPADVRQKQQIQAVEELRAVVAKQGNVTPEQFQNLLDMTTAALTKLDMTTAALTRLDMEVNSDGLPPPNVLLDANASKQPFKGSDDPLADRDKFEKDYVKNGDNNEDDEPMLFPKTEKEEKLEGTSTNSTLDFEEGEPREQKWVLATYVVVPISFVFLFIFTIANVMEKFSITAIPESGIIIVIGMLLGTFMKMYGHFEFFEDPDRFAELNSAILNLILLPIIIFASGWSIRRQDFFSQFPYILLFAVAGVALSTGVIGSLIVLTGSMGFHSVTRWRTALAYASLISATDPIATLSTYAKLKVEPLLNIMVFGESIINDAVAIVLFGVFNADDYMVDSSGKAFEGLTLLGSIVWGVLKIFCSSTLLGIGLGIIYTLIAHWADMRHNKKGQILVIFASCYLTYALAESLGMSGIIAEMFAALLMGIYMRPHLSSEGSLLATFFVKQLAALADAAVCLLIGVSVIQLTTKGWYFGLWVMLFCLVGRFCAVFPVAIVVNWIKSNVGKANGVHPDGWNLLTPQHMFMMWHAGLRGAIAMALSLELGKWVDVIDGAGTRRALQTATFFILCTFLLIFGGSTAACLNWLGIRSGDDLAQDYLSKTEDMGAIHGFLKWLDKKVLSPLLVGKTFFIAGEEEKDVEDLLKNVHRW